MDNDDIIFRILKFLSEQHFGGKMNYLINIDEVIKGAGLDNVDRDKVLGNISYLYGEKFVNGIMTLGVPHPISIYINSKGITKYNELKKPKGSEQKTKVGFLHRTRNIFGHSVPEYRIVIGTISTIVLGTISIWLPPLQCQFQVGVQDETYVNCPLGFQISRPSPDWSFNDVKNQLKLSENSVFLGGIAVQSPYYDNVRVLVFKNNLISIYEFRQNEIQTIKNEYNITSMWTLPTPNEPDLIQLIAKNKNSTIFLKERVETQNGKIFVIQQNAQVFFAPLSNDTMNTLNQIYQSFGYKS